MPESEGRSVEFIIQIGVWGTAHRFAGAAGFGIFEFAHSFTTPVNRSSTNIGMPIIAAKTPNKMMTASVLLRVSLADLLPKSAIRIIKVRNPMCINHSKGLL